MNKTKIIQAIKDAFGEQFEVVGDIHEIPICDEDYTMDRQECPFWLTDWIEHLYEVPVKFHGRDFTNQIRVAVPTSEMVILSQPMFYYKAPEASSGC